MQAMGESEEVRARNAQLEDEIRDVQQMLAEQQKIYSSHINELKI